MHVIDGLLDHPGQVLFTRYEFTVGGGERRVIGNGRRVVARIECELDRGLVVVGPDRETDGAVVTLRVADAGVKVR
ncbi:hypothetical protein ACFY0F_37855 [Streptomyces sp. NPDC001544]|uniref:hypothetical protein n=1 Tax=Streptomyces sp. NPDC001544 TaxID=3364584 RepID=UPI003683DE1E